MISFGRCAVAIWMAIDLIRSQEISTPIGKISSDNSSLSDSHLRQYYVTRDTPVGFLNGQELFLQLKRNEKCKVHFLSRASWMGGLIDFYQTSPESPLIFLLLQNIFRSDDISNLQTKITQRCQFSLTEWNAFLAYVATFYENHGNYFFIGKSKFVPEVSQSKVSCLVNAVSTGDQAHRPVDITVIWSKVKNLMFNLDKRHRHQDFLPNGITTYFSSNCDANDAEIVKEYLVSKHVEPWNSRVIKTVNETGHRAYEIRSASVQPSNDSVDGVALGVVESFKGNQFVFTRGDFSPILRRVTDYLTQAKACIDVDLEQRMTDYLIDSFLTGSVTAHKNASRLWLHHRNPLIESYLGFIETYQDPDGMRGSFEGFVAVVDREKSRVLDRLVQNAEKFLLLLPWPRQFEKAVFKKPDFTDLTVITFVHGYMPSGINNPNYKDVVESDGFKNFYLGNAVAATLQARPVQYLSAKDAKMLTDGRKLTFEIIVALHELLGHGSGKLFREDSNGKVDFNATEIGIVENYGIVKHWYKPGQTYESKFGVLGNTMEECRSESVTMYLCLFPEVMAIWGLNATEAEHYGCLLWLEEAYLGLDSLAEYQPDADTWGESHAQGYFALLRIMMEAQVATVEIITNSVDGKPDLLVKLDRKRIRTEGKRALGQFLRGLQFFRSTGDADGAQTFYSKYTSLRLPENQKYLEWYRISLKRKQPRTLVVQHNTVASTNLFSSSSSSCRPLSQKTGCFPEIELKRYNASFTGMIQSYLDRFPDVTLETEMLALVDADWNHFVV